MLTRYFTVTIYLIWERTFMGRRTDLLMYRVSYSACNRASQPWKSPFLEVRDMSRRSKASGGGLRRCKDQSDDRVSESRVPNILIHQSYLSGAGRLTPGSLVLVRYLDHLAFRWADPKSYGPCVRETVGWVLEDNDRYLELLWDRGAGKLPEEKPDPCCGIAILKSDILEVKVLELG